jgi:hypothetical protein
MGIWDEQELLEELEQKRNISRVKGIPMAFDCFRLKDKGKGITECPKEVLPLMYVLRGAMPYNCGHCKLYEADWD